MQTLLFHIGYHRTGTTFLQSLLNANRAHLASLGCLYPITGLTGDSHSQLALCLPSRRNELLRATRSAQTNRIGKNPDTCPPPTELYSRLADELARSKLPHAIVSSECFLEYLDVAALREQLDIHSFHAEFVVFVRRQDRWIESVFSQVVNDPNLLYGGTLQTLPQLQMLDFALEIKRWKDCLSDSRIHIRLYHERTENQQIADELLGILGVGRKSFPANLVHLEDLATNASLDETCVCLLRQLNEWNLTSGAIHALIRSKSDEFRQRNIFANWRLAPADAAEINRRFESGNQWIFDHFDVGSSLSWGYIPPLAYSSQECKLTKYEELLNSVSGHLPVRYQERLRKGVPW